MTVLQEFDSELRSPFMLGNNACALRPQGRTAKQAYDDKVVCSQQVAARGPIIKSVFGSASTPTRQHSWTEGTPT